MLEKVELLLWCNDNDARVIEPKKEKQKRQFYNEGQLQYWVIGKTVNILFFYIIMCVNNEQDYIIKDDKGIEKPCYKYFQ